MKTIAMIMTLAAGLASFGLAASADNATKEPAHQTTHTAQEAMVPMTGTSAFVPMRQTGSQQPPLVTDSSKRQ